MKSLEDGINKILKFAIANNTHFIGCEFCKNNVVYFHLKINDLDIHMDIYKTDIQENITASIYKGGELLLNGFNTPEEMIKEIQELINQ